MFLYTMVTVRFFHVDLTSLVHDINEALLIGFTWQMDKINDHNYTCYNSEFLNISWCLLLAFQDRKPTMNAVANKLNCFYGSVSRACWRGRGRKLMLPLQQTLLWK